MPPIRIKLEATKKRSNALQYLRLKSPSKVWTFRVWREIEDFREEVERTRDAERFAALCRRFKINNKLVREFRNQNFLLESSQAKFVAYSKDEAMWFEKELRKVEQLTTLQFQCDRIIRKRKA